MRVGVGWLTEQVVRIGDLDDLSEVHHCDSVANVVDDVECVSDEDECETVLLLDLLEQIQDLGLNGHVQCAGWLVEENELRVQRECPR